MNLPFAFIITVLWHEILRSIFTLKGYRILLSVVACDRKQGIAWSTGTTCMRCSITCSTGELTQSHWIHFTCQWTLQPRNPIWTWSREDHLLLPFNIHRRNVFKKEFLETAWLNACELNTCARNFTIACYTKNVRHFVPENIRHPVVGVISSYSIFVNICCKLIDMGEVSRNLAVSKTTGANAWERLSALMRYFTRCITRSCPWEFAERV